MLELLSLGEVLWDLFPDGRRLGGAPFNLAYHAFQLGVPAGCVSRVGDDTLGSMVREKARESGLPVELIQVDAALPTGTVDVQLDAAGKPTFVVTERVAWDAIELPANLPELLHGVQALAFGTLAQRSSRTRGTLREILACSRARYKLCDINLRPPFVDPDIVRASLDAANLLKLNDDELRIVRSMLDLPDGEGAACRSLRRRFQLEFVCVTRGADGCSVHGADGCVDVPGKQVSVADTVGAGDAFAAGFLARLLRGAPVASAARFANAVGALVASKRGATPPIDPREASV